MFRVILCSSSGGGIVLMQHLVLPYVSDRPACARDGPLERVLRCINTIRPSDDDHSIAQNM